MVGRWPSGAPLVASPHRDDPALRDHDAFGYAAGDASGLACPFGSHIRRSNPRDWGPGDTAQEGAKNAAVHRIMRRGRPYGAPLIEDMSIAKMIGRAVELARSGDGSQRRGRGLHFLCFNADIRRQFEFVQQTWINNPKFAGLKADEDPLLGDQSPSRLSGAPATFTIQSDPLRWRVTGLKRFVRVRGGAYFFMPGMQGLEMLAW
jgi:deferrochelatase/peroxidase EfeB